MISSVVYINHTDEAMIYTDSVIDAVKHLLQIDIKFTDYDFSMLSKRPNMDFSNYGAAMCVHEINNHRQAIILLNKKETPQMKRFSLVHELGHLMAQKDMGLNKYFISTHIDMDITSIPEDILNQQNNKFLLDEQVANIFALLVLIPYNMLQKEIESVKAKKKTWEETADFFGVEISALFSRLELSKFDTM